MEALELLEDLVFLGEIKQSQALAKVSGEVRHFLANDVLYLSTGISLMLLRRGPGEIEVVRMDKHRHRRLGGVLYRKWLRKENRLDFWGELEGPYVPPPKRRAKPLVARCLVWKDLIIPAGTKLIRVSTAYAEGSAQPQ